MKARKGKRLTSKPGKSTPSQSNLEKGLSSSEMFNPADHSPSSDNPLQLTQGHKDVSAPNGTIIRGV